MLVMTDTFTRRSFRAEGPPPDAPDANADNADSPTDAKHSVFSDNVVMDYATMCWRNYTSVTGADKSTLKDHLAEYRDYLHRRTNVSVRQNAMDGRFLDFLEWGVRFVSLWLSPRSHCSIFRVMHRCRARCYVGCGDGATYEDRVTLARVWWNGLVKVGSPRYSAVRTPNNVRARGYSCMADLYFDGRFQAPAEDTSELVVDAVVLYTAAGFANECVRHGLTTQTVLDVARFVDAQGWRRNAPPRPFKRKLHEEYSDPERFEKLVHLWRALDKADGKFGNTPDEDDTARSFHGLRCSAPGCGIEATEAVKLKRCSGRCPPDYKPSYCDHDCQRRVRRIDSNPTRRLLIDDLGLGETQECLQEE